MASVRRRTATATRPLRSDASASDGSPSPLARVSRSSSEVVSNPFSDSMVRIDVRRPGGAPRLAGERVGLAGEPQDAPASRGASRGRQRPRLVVHDEEAAGRRQARRPGRRWPRRRRRSGRARRPPRPRSSASGRVEAGLLEGRGEPFALEVDGDRHDRARGRCEVADPALLVRAATPGGRPRGRWPPASSGIRQARESRPAPSTTTCAAPCARTASSIAMVRGTISRPVRRTSS